MVRVFERLIKNGVIAIPITSPYVVGVERHPKLPENLNVFGVVEYLSALENIEIHGQPLQMARVHCLGSPGVEIDLLLLLGPEYLPECQLKSVLVRKLNELVDVESENALFCLECHVLLFFGLTDNCDDKTFHLFHVVFDVLLALLDDLHAGMLIIQLNVLDGIRIVELFDNRHHHLEGEAVGVVSPFYLLERGQKGTPNPYDEAGHDGCGYILEIDHPYNGLVQGLFLLLFLFR